MKHLLLLIILILTFSIQMFAASFVVNNSGDTNDANTSDNLCADSAGNCTLRAAVQQANNSTGDDTITFSLTLPVTINLTIGEINTASNITISGGDARGLIVQRSAATGTANFRVFHIAGSNTVVNISGLTIANGFSDSGGGIRNGYTNTLNLSDVSIRNNIATVSGGGILNLGILNITRATIDSNTCSQGCGINNNGANFDGSATISNSTITNNNATNSFNTNGGMGGGISNFANPVILTNVTVSHNTATFNVGGVNGANVFIRNTIIAKNTAPNYPDFSIVTSLGNNLLGIESGLYVVVEGATGDKLGTISNPLDPKLGALQNNGGQTDTRALLFGSPAIDAGNNCVANFTCPSNNPFVPLLTDQRGAARIQDGDGDGTAIIDIGSYESATVAVQCTYSLSLSDIYIEPSGGAAGLVLTTQPGCAWTAVNNVSWITVNNPSGTGSGTIGFTVAPNTGPNRSGTITIGGQILAISQSSGCTYTLSSNNAFYPVSGGTGSFNVITAPGCAWTAQTSAYFITITSGASGVGNGTVTYTVPSNPSLVRGGTIEAAGQTFTVTQNENGPIQPRRAAYDFDGDGKSDFSIYRPSVGEWWYLRSSDGGNRAFQFGTSTDKIVPADYTGDGKTDFAFYRPSSGQWFILRSEDFSYYAFPFGIAEDIPAPADYDGDGRADAAVYRPSTNVWYILKSTGGVTIQQYGASGDAPVPADYDGDGKTDLALYNSSTRTWRVRTANSESALSIFGTNTNKPVPADYTGDGKADIAFYDLVIGSWIVIRSENGTTYTARFGASGDIPAPADYDGDGKTDFAIYRPSTGEWWYAPSSATSQMRITRFGISTDIPVPSAYVPQ